LKPALVVEVSFDHFSQGRFRHGTKFLRWRPDKMPRQCTMDQVKRGPALKLLNASRDTPASASRTARHGKPDLSRP
jgi:hypothetical protein